MQLDALAQQEQKEVQVPGIPDLCDLAATGLVNMLDPETHLFCHIYCQTEGGMVRQGVSHRYTMMTLLGLGRYERSGRRSPVAIAPVLDALLCDTGWIKSAGDLGLLLWTCAELAPERLAEVYEGAGAEGALERFPDGRRGCTMEVAWYLTGIASCYQAGHANLPGLAEQASAARQILELNCGVSGVYGHLSRAGSLAGYVRGRIGSFADQVYPTIAFARLAQALRDQKARQMSLPGVFSPSTRHGADDAVRSRRGDWLRFQRRDLRRPGLDQRQQRASSRLCRAISGLGVAQYLS
jgi:hypothetical protein